MEYPSETFTEAERARLAPHFSDLDGPVFALLNLPETVKGALFARYSRYPGTLRRLFLDEFAELAAGAAGGLGHERRGRSGGTAVRENLPRLRRRLGRAARWRARRLRVGLERADEGAAAAAARRLPGAVDALHRLRRADAGGRLPLLPGRGAGSPVRVRDGRAVLDLRGAAAARLRLGGRAVPTPRRRGGGGARARDQGEGARPAARPAAGRLALAHGDLRDRPDVRAADPPPARAPAAGGAALRDDDPARGAVDDPVVRHASRAPRPRWRVGRVPAHARGGRARVGRAACAHRGPRRRRRRPVGEAAARRGQRGRPARRALYEASGVPEERAHAAAAALDGERRAALLRDLVGVRENRRHRPAAASRLSTIGSRSCPTTGLSGISSGIGC